MSGTPKVGIDYAGWSVNVFDGDKKIDKLLDAQGWRGFGVYFFLCQAAYKMNGYYLEWDYDDSATTARKMGGGIGSETVSETVNLCLQVGLFDKGLFDRWKVLTSKGIQRRFWAVTGERRVVPLHKDFWLLSPEEADGLAKRARFDDLPPANSHLPPANGYKQSKAKQSKVNKSTMGAFAPPSRDDVRAYAQSRNGGVDPDRFFDFFDAGNWVDSKGNPVRNWKQKFITWESKGKERGESGRAAGDSEGVGGKDQGNGKRWNIKATLTV